MPFNDLSAPLFLYPTAHQQTALKKRKQKRKISSNSNQTMQTFVRLFFFHQCLKHGCKECCNKVPSCKNRKGQGIFQTFISMMTLHFGCVALLRINHLFHKTMSIHQVFPQHEPHSYKKVRFHFTISHKKIKKNPNQTIHT